MCNSTYFVIDQNSSRSLPPLITFSIVHANQFIVLFFYHVIFMNDNALVCAIIFVSRNLLGIVAEAFNSLKNQDIFSHAENGLL